MMFAFNISVAGYRNDEHITTINMYKPFLILNENHQQFDYEKSLPDIFLFVPQSMKPSVYRLICCEFLYFLWERFRSEYEWAYQSPDKWCDEILSNKDCFKCPSGGSYAMNPNCKLNSPGDMVLLFETKAGWNQHGGQELFTFDNHEPKGGCVLLNDGTVKFIRTEEELHKLRWK